MASPPRIVGFGGALGASSTSLLALRLALAGAESAGAETVVYDVRELALPMYEHGAEPPAAAVALADAMHDADGLVWSSPLYHGSVSGVFKNAIDWLELLSDREPPYLTDKPVGLIGTSGGAQSMQSINTLDFIVRALRGWVVPFSVPLVSSGKAFDAAGAAVEPRVDAQLRMLGAEVVRAARLFRAANP
jgi:FMN reductase